MVQKKGQGEKRQAEAKLCIELDGETHVEPDQAEYDAARTVWLEARGYRVIRFQNDDVHHRLDAVPEAIRLACVERTRRLDSATT